ncbi:MAG: cobalamin biosynthesis protein [Methanosarcinaceae archaeon]|nr:cobalamin biosynthesis protein [Methanosarcinaceae archaeon]MDD4331160.1 cobalamin biosynthesis protein [Methanosarcinaceae archaeon]MDD4748671.1 cobalamin biosynthesis protein [Methanosarcinaceae archaeon]
MLNPESLHLAQVLLLAVAIDIFLGEPPAALHPVVWIGKLIGVLKAAAPEKHRTLYGIGMALTCVFFSGSLAYLVLFISRLSQVPEILGLFLEAYFLKATFAIRCLLSPATEIYENLKSGKLDAAKQLLPIYVSRNPKSLTKPQIASAVVESVSENFVDGILTPIFFYALFGNFGLVAAYCYKAINTLDSMVGYKNEPYRELGFFSAKSDDVLNWVPARLSVFIITAAAFIVAPVPQKGGKIRPLSCLKTAFQEGAKTPSPNSGYPMAAAAGALGVSLQKPGIYVLGKKFRPTEIRDIKRVSGLITAASGLSVLLFTYITWALGA